MNRTRLTRAGVALAALSALVVAPAASAYELPATPGTLAKPAKKITKLTVQKSACSSPTANKTCFTTIQAAVNASKQTTHKVEYTITVMPGTYAESVTVEGHALDGLTIQGSTSKAADTKIDLSTLKGDAHKNAITVNATSGVTIKNLTVTHYGENGLWFVNVGVPADYVNTMDGGNVLIPNPLTQKLSKNELFGGKAYTVDNVTASFGGRYGIFARTSVGGTITNSEAYYNDDSGFYIGETPAQTKPSRTYITGVKSWGNALGYSGTNSRYVTINKGSWFNNGMGIVPNIVMGEHWPAPSFNVYTDNDIYGNNFNYYEGAPFPSSSGQFGGGASYPVGIGILLFGSQDSEISKNRVWGNKLAGVAAINPGILLKGSGNWNRLCGADNSLKTADCLQLKDATELKRNKIFGNAFGRLGLNRNGRDITYANDGIGNCVGGTGANANTFGGSQTSLYTVGRTDKPSSTRPNDSWQSCDKSAYSATLPNKITFAYFWMLTFAANDSSSGSGPNPAIGDPGLGANDPTGQDYVDNSHFEGRWWVWPGTESSWPSQYGKPLERCKITAPYQGCDGFAFGKP